MSAVTSDQFLQSYVISAPSAGGTNSQPLQDLHHQAVGAHVVTFRCDFIASIKGLCGAKSEQKASRVRAGKARACLRVCVCHHFAPTLFLTATLRLYVGFDACLPADYTHELTAGMLLTERLWSTAYEKSKPRCFCNVMRRKTNVGVHGNVQASLLAWAGSRGGRRPRAFLKRVKLSPPGSRTF